MSSLITNATIQIKQDTAGNWTSNNPTPASGEWCLETDTEYTKLGDGSTEWTSLDYQPNPAEVDGKANLSTYSTAWINRSDWTNVHIGSDDTKDTDSNVTHNLDAPLSDLIVKLFISTDGSEANSFEIISATSTTGSFGYSFQGVDNDNIIVQTGSVGLAYIDAVGSAQGLIANDWYYKIKVYKLS